jgi:hypothetical protein
MWVVQGRGKIRFGNEWRDFGVGDGEVRIERGWCMMFVGGIERRREGAMGWISCGRRGWNLVSFAIYFFVLSF